MTRTILAHGVALGALALGACRATDSPVSPVTAASSEVHAGGQEATASAAPTGTIWVVGKVRAGGGPNTVGADTTLLEAVLAAGPVSGSADLGRVHVLRPAEGAPLVFTVDVEAMLASGDTTQNLLLRDGDVVLVPR